MATAAAATEAEAAAADTDRRMGVPAGFERNRCQEAVQALAAQGVFLGTSSWKYPLCRSRHNGYFAEYRIMPSVGEDPTIGEGITSFLKVTLGIIKGFAGKPELGWADDSDSTGL